MRILNYIWNKLKERRGGVDPLTAGIMAGGSIVSSLIGGSGSSGGVKKVSTLDPKQQAILNELAGYLSGKAGIGATPYTGQTTAAISPWEEKAIAALEELTKGASPDEVEKRFNTLILPKERRILDEEILPRILESYAGPTGGTVWGTQRAREQSRAIQSWGETMGQTLADLIQKEREVSLQAAPLLAQYGALPRLIEQQELTAKMNEWLRTRPEYSPYIDMMLKVLSIPTTAIGVQQGSANPFASMLGSAAPFMWSNLLSGNAASTNPFMASSLGSARNQALNSIPMDGGVSRPAWMAYLS